ncbi:glycosyltransferase family 4 protein [Luteimonas suaedae]|uniref:glycosyltransferase family 4 protein n=1 Tax=Luteimonas suaedae TaxID=2605430 RepID=UPI0021027A25|nr:glycosyltransferase family 4 protein [Luteimonas suaedae]
MTTDTVGGVWQYALELCRQLTARGDQVLLATMGAEPSRAQRGDAESIEHLQLECSGYRLIWMKAPWPDIERAGHWLRALAHEFRPDVVHLNDYAHGDLPWTAPVLMVGHSCVLSWWRAVHGTPVPPEWQRYRRRVRAGLQAADLVVAPTRGMLRALQRHYGPLAATRVIANGRSRTRVGEVRQTPLVFAAGRLWDEAKNVRTLADIAPRLPWPVCIAGSERHPDGGQALLPNVRLLGQLPEAKLRSWCSRASIYALPARYEPFGLSPLEAAQAGCALVLGDIPTLREVWGDAAVFVAPDDHEALAREILRLIVEPAVRRDYAARARRRAQRYTPQAMADGYCAAYAELLQGRARPRARAIKEVYA